MPRSRKHSRVPIGPFARQRPAALEVQDLFPAIEGYAPPIEPTSRGASTGDEPPPVRRAVPEQSTVEGPPPAFRE